MSAERRCRSRPVDPLLPPRLTVLLALLLVGCSSGTSPDAADQGEQRPGEPASTSAALPEVASYVALGDSYTAAPLVPSTDLAEGCFRSDGNYPSLLAEQLQPGRFVDVSCSGAETGDLTGPQATAGGRGRVPPQLRVVRPSTDLVTLGIGANDEGFFAGLASRCISGDSATRCTETFLRQSDAVLARTRDRVAGVLQQVQDAAPRATVVLVGYPRLVAPDQPCSRLPVPPSRLAEVAATEVRLNRVLRAAAASAGAEFVDMHPASRGHEICSDDPWINGRRTDDQAALAFHPFAAGQAAVAEQVLDELRRGDGA